TPEEITIGVASIFIKEWLHDHYLKTIREVFADLHHIHPTIEFRIAAKPFKELRKNQADIELPRESVPEVEIKQPQAIYRRHNLNNELRLEKFIIGSGSQLAFGACRRVVDSPAEFNPLVIYGGSGLGKTHLLQGVCNAVRERDRELEVLYTSFEEFTRSFIKAVEEKRRHHFLNRFQSCDLLVMDDLHAIAQGKREKTQMEFLHVFDKLLNQGKQVIISSDQHPRQITGLHPKLAQRLCGGLVLKLDSPTLETRVKIIQAKAAQRGLQLTEEVAELVAGIFTGCVRELEGAISQLAAISRISHIELNSQAVTEILQPPELTENEVNLAPGMSTVVEAVAESFGMTPEQLIGRSRTARIRTPRAVAMIFAREVTGASYSEIGRYFGGRSHATVLCAIKNARNLARGDSVAAQLIRKLQKQFSIPQQKPLLPPASE
ncbi:MAG: chromosomal replication initiator protein DnaA, partial [Planctomycetes bacterium]|nr:chromosomal replication initiator protein DnaA [Planctomycetota bacterium]